MKFSKEVKVGVITLLALVTLYFGVKFLKGVELLSSNRTYYAIYPQISGLKISNPVILNGYPVGRVSMIKLIPERGYSMLVGLEITAEVLIGDRTVAYLTDPALLGDKAIKLEIDQTGGYLADGDTLIGKIDKGITGILQERALPILSTIDSTSDIVNALLKEYSGTGPVVKNTIESTNQLIGTLNQKMGQLNVAEINQTIANVRMLTDTLAMVSKELAPVMKDLNAITDSLNQVPIVAISQDLQKTVNNLNDVVVLLKQQEGTAGMLLNDKELYEKLTKTVTDLDALLIDLKENPKKYINVSVF